MRSFGTIACIRSETVFELRARVQILIQPSLWLGGEKHVLRPRPQEVGRPRYAKDRHLDEDSSHSKDPYF